MFKLVISDDEGKTNVVPLVWDEVTIGRDEQNRIRLTERNVSRTHAKLEKLNGTYTVSDLDSYMGVKVNGQKIQGTSKLKAGDQISIGDYLLAYHMAVSDSITDPSSAALEATDPLAMATQETAIIRSPTEGGSPGRLVMVTPPTPGAEFVLTADSSKIGRVDDAAVWVNHKSISREHAEITKTGDSFRIADLGSANGVRVNGRDVKNVELRGGDIIELGNVRFRYVAPGETYVFDAEHTGQTDALGRGDGSSRAPLYAIFTVVCLGLAAVGVMYFRGNQPAPNNADASPAAGAAAPAMSELSIAEAVASCRRALGEKRFSDAVRAVSPVLAAVPNREDAVVCKHAAEAGVADEENFGRGMQALAAGDVDSAYSAFSTLSEGSPFLNQPEVRETGKKYAEFHLAQAQAAAKRDPRAAREHAELVTAMHDGTDEWKAAAAKVLARAGISDGASDGAGDSAKAAVATVKSTPPSSTTKATHRTPTSARAGAATTDSAGGTSATQLCAAEGGDVSACVVRKIGGNARSPAEMSELIEAYRQLRDTANMQKFMRRFTELYPSHPKARAYSQILLRQGAQ